MLSYNITRFQIAVPVNDAQWATMMKWDAWDCDDEDFPTSLEIIKELEAEGASKIEWNGHFGQFFYFTCDADFETDPEWGRTNVNRIITKFESLLDATSL